MLASEAPTPRLVFWDFDGVIKESVDVKTQAFVRLFAPFGVDLAARVKAHHEAHGGISRFVKMPLYLGWAGQAVSEAHVHEWCDRFGHLVMASVVAAAWVPGAEPVLRQNPLQQRFVLVSATPTDELHEILKALDLGHCFEAVFGASTSKKAAIRQVLQETMEAPSDCVMIGDARADLDAANANDVPFLLRQHASNTTVFADYNGPAIKDLNECLRAWCGGKLDMGKHD